MLKGARILIVEDAWVIAVLLTDLLRECGCVVVGPAHDLAKAIELAYSGMVDCALLDLSVGDERVYPVAKILDDRGIPFVFTTGHKKNQICESFRNRPMLRKPFSGEHLKAVLGRLIAPLESKRNTSA